MEILVLLQMSIWTVKSVGTIKKIEELETLRKEFDIELEELYKDYLFDEKCLLIIPDFNQISDETD